MENGKIKNQGCYEDIVDEFPHIAKLNERSNFSILNLKENLCTNFRVGGSNSFRTANSRWRLLKTVTKVCNIDKTYHRW